MNTNDFLAQMKVKCELKAKQMNDIELSIWDSNHEQQLKQYFGFTDKKLSQRKKILKSS